MRTIIKGREPQSLTEYRLTPDSNYLGYSHKEDLRSALVTEQRGLCCYCMNRVSNGPDTMKIEHWQSRHYFQNRQLDYSNMLGSCNGGVGLPPNLQHCDTKKDDNELKFNPANSNHFIERRLYYEADGRIRSDDAEFDAQLDDVLNLNLPFLKNSRKKKLDGILNWYKDKKRRLRGPIPKNDFERKREKIIGRVGDLEPYCQIAVWWLDKKITRMSA